MNFARIVNGPPCPADVASMMWTHVKHLTPGASCAFFLGDPVTDSVAARFVAGEASSVLQGLTMGVGERLTGWVAANQQPIVNSDAGLDLGPIAAVEGWRYCLALPMVCEARLVGVLTLYAREQFANEQTRALGMVTPHLPGCSSPSRPARSQPRRGRRRRWPCRGRRRRHREQSGNRCNDSAPWPMLRHPRPCGPGVKARRRRSITGSVSNRACGTWRGTPERHDPVLTCPGVPSKAAGDVMRKGLLVAVSVWIAGCGTAAPPPSHVWPTKEWTLSTPEAEGLDPAPLAALDREFAAGTHGQVTGLVVTRRGRLVFERHYTHDFDRLFEGRDPARGPYNYYDPEWHPYYQHGPLHTMQSVSKSVTSALVGIAVGRGELPAVTTKVMPLLSTFRQPAPDPRRDQMTLEHVLTMTTGIRWDESTVAYTDPANSCAGMEQSADWVQFVLDQPMADAPGTRFVYNSGATELLSQLLKQGTGRQAHEYAAEYLFGPLGITDTYWKTTPSGLADTEGGLYLTARDLAKIGYLYLRDGVWGGRRILPEGWVAKSTTPLIDTRPGQARSRKYGYQWWVLPPLDGAVSAYAALGYGGQRLIVVPELELVAVVTGWNIYEHAELAPYAALDRILESVRR